MPRASLTPLSLIHPLMVSPFQAPATACHMMQTKAGAIGVTQRVAPLLDWLREATIEPKQGIAALTIVNLADSKLAQQ